ncbi:hypothetical protein [Sorangium sp. So ce1099]|uniref:hypothetical protein n=1 Tax=Sorangium sp. So ce1099 TaxID=3133331 RepID=UPI003F60E06B
MKAAAHARPAARRPILRWRAILRRRASLLGPTIDVPDVTLGAAGDVGLWARASFAACFDELEVRPFAARLHPDELLRSPL